jgi:carbamoylphosphate synthase small subunit
VPMKVNRVAYLPQPDGQVESMFRKKGWVTTHDPKILADAVVFTGGADVTPFLYGEHALRCTNNDPARDMREIKVFKRLDRDVPKIGICRGGQFLNVMCGGTMWQDVDGHACGPHDLIDLMTGHVVRVTSTHHQMMVPGDAAVEVAGACQSTYKQSEAGKYSYVKVAQPTKKDCRDTEVLYYPEDKTLCFQPHPEYEGHPDCTAYFWNLVNDLLFMDDRHISVG